MSTEYGLPVDCAYDLVEKPDDFDPKPQTSLYKNILAADCSVMPGGRPPCFLRNCSFGSKAGLLFRELTKIALALRSVNYGGLQDRNGRQGKEWQASRDGRQGKPGTKAQICKSKLLTNRQGPAPKRSQMAAKTKAFLAGKEDAVVRASRIDRTSHGLRRGARQRGFHLCPTSPQLAPGRTPERAAPGP